MEKANIMIRIREGIPRMSKSNKLIARFVLDNIRRVPFMTITEMSEEIGVSTATISRFSHGMGFGGFWQFQKQFEQVLVGHVPPYDQLKSSVDCNGTHCELCSAINDAVFSLSGLYSEDLAAAVDDSAQMILGSRIVFIMGARAARAPALYLYYALKETCANVFFLENVNDDISFKLQHVDKDDLLLAITYPKYSRFTAAMAEFAQKRGARVAAMTDELSAPICKYCSVVMPIRNSGQAFACVNTIAAINALVKTLNKLRNTEARAHNLEDAIAQGLNLCYDLQEGTYDTHLSALS